MNIFHRIAEFITNQLLQLATCCQPATGVSFFFENSLKVFFLLTLTIYLAAFVRAGLKTSKFKAYLSGKNRLLAYLLASLLGAVTPFCSCSGIALFLGFTAARIPLGITMAFLITSPMINEAAAVLLVGTVGWELTAIYLLFGIFSGFLGGIIFDAVKAERCLILPESSPCGCGEMPPEMTWRLRHRFAWREVKSILSDLWLWILTGIALGAVINGMVPQDFITRHLNAEQLWSVPAAVLLGIPTYANITGIIPVVAALIDKGLPTGTAFAFMMSATAASLPEFIILKKVMKTRLLIYFFLYLLTFFTLCGWFLNIFY